MIRLVPKRLKVYYCVLCLFYSYSFQCLTILLLLLKIARCHSYINSCFVLFCYMFCLSFIISCKFVCLKHINFNFILTIKFSSEPGWKADRLIQNRSVSPRNGAQDQLPKRAPIFITVCSEIT